MINIGLIVQAYATAISAVVAIFSLAMSIITQVKLKNYRRIQTTIECFNIIQNQVFDPLEEIIDNKNALYIVEAMEEGNQQCQEAYNAYRVLIARLEHFSVGVSEKIYDFEIVDKLAGLYLIDLFYKIEPIIDKANEDYINNEYFNSFVNLIHRLEEKHPDRPFIIEYEEANK